MIGMGSWVQVFCLILDSSVGLCVGIQSAGDLVSYMSQLRMLHSAKEDNLSLFDSKIACLCQSIKINNNTHILYVIDLKMGQLDPVAIWLCTKWACGFEWPRTSLFPYTHNDVIKWKLFPRYWPFVRGIHRSPVNSPHKGQWRRALIFSLICA